MLPLANELDHAARKVRTCVDCGNFDLNDLIKLEIKKNTEDAGEIIDLQKIEDTDTLDEFENLVYNTLGYYDIIIASYLNQFEKYIN